MQENGLKWHFLTSVLLFFPAFGAKLLKYLVLKLEIHCMLYMKQRLRKYGIESAVTFGKSRSRLHVREKWHKIGFFGHFYVDFATI